MKKEDIVNTFTLFINEVVCKRDSNQHKATKYYDILKPYISHIESIDIIDAWSEYRNGDISINVFGNVLKEIKLKYIN